MSINLANLYAVEYSTNVSLLLQQKGSRLRGTVMSGTHTGKQASPVDQVGAIEAQPVTSRFAPMGRVDAAVDRRWVVPTDFDLPQLVDTFDKLRLFSDPESVYTQNAVYAFGRKIDDIIIGGLFNNNMTGIDGTTSTPFLSSNVVGVNTGGSASSLNVAKLRAAKKLLMSYEVDFDNDPVYCPITSVEHDALLNEIQIISSDFNSVDRPVLVEGKVTRFLGINFLHCERLTNFRGTDDQSGTSTPIPVYPRSGVHLGIWGDVTANPSQRNDIQGEPYQIYAKGTFGATRTEEKKVVKIWCR